MRALSFAVALLLASPLFAQDWPQWRGPTFNGFSPAKNLPSELVKGQELWSTPIPGHGNGTPIIIGDKIFTTSHNGSKLVALCLAKVDGKNIWQKDIAESTQRNNRNDLSSPSPVSDGKSVIFLFASGDLAAFDLGGNELWKRNLQKDHGNWNIQWIYGSSPLLYKDKLYVQVLHRNGPAGRGGQRGDGRGTESYLLGINPQTGKDLWKVVRPTQAAAESMESYATPIPWERPARTEIVLVGGDCVTGHDPENGKELWRAGDWNPQRIGHWRLVPSAVTWEGLVFSCAPKGEPVFAWKEGGSGDITKTHNAWTSREFTSDVSVPLIYNNLLYVFDGDKKQLHCVDPATGKRKWGGSIQSRQVIRTSPTGADGKIYVMNEAGTVWVLSTEEFKILSQVELGGDGSRGSIAVTDGMVVIRTGDKLWAFGNKK
jgi:outer membrane protein assembly factor BamB